MGIYKYKNGLLGAKVKDYNNEKQMYDITTTDKEIAINTKSGEPVCIVDVEDKNKIFIHTMGDFIGIEKYNKSTKKTNVVIFKGTEIVKDVKLSGEIESIIAGSENFYFKKFVGSHGYRFYHQIFKDNDVAVTPKWQVIQHESQDDGLDRFYCENYRELSKAEFMEEDDYEYDSNIQEMAVYLSNGRRIYDKSFGSGTSIDSKSFDSEYHSDMILGASLAPLSPIASSAVMINAMLKKRKKEKEEQNNNSKSDDEYTRDEDENTFGY